MKSTAFFCLFGSLLLSGVDSHFLDRTVFVIMSQEAHDETSETSRLELKETLAKDGVKEPQIALLHKDLPSHGGWTIFPLLAPLWEKYSASADWYVFLDEAGTVHPGILKEVLNKHNPEDLVFLGKALQDQDSVIIHHYSQNLKFKYPDFAAGLVFSSFLVATLATELEDSNFELEDFPKDFSIGKHLCDTSSLFLF